MGRQEFHIINLSNLWVQKAQLANSQKKKTSNRHLTWETNQFGGWTNPFETYAYCVKLDPFPRFRGENKRYLKPPPRQEKKPRDPFVCPKNPGFPRTNPMTWGWDVSIINPPSILLDREGSGVSGFENIRNQQTDTQWVFSVPSTKKKTYPLYYQPALLSGWWFSFRRDILQSFPGGVTDAKNNDDTFSSEKRHIESSQAFGANLLRIFSSSFPRFVKCCAVLKTSMPAHVSWESWRVKFDTNEPHWFGMKLRCYGDIWEISSFAPCMVYLPTFGLKCMVNV